MNVSSITLPSSRIRAHVLEPLGTLSFEREPELCSDSAMNTSVREAYEKGLAEGKAQTEQTLVGAAQALGEVFQRLQSAYAGAQENMKHEVLHLSMAVARQIALCELRTNRQAVAEMVEHLLAEADGRKVFAVRMNPRDVESLKGTSAESELVKAQVAVQASEEVPPGGCILDTAFGQLDARLETRIDEVATALLGKEGMASRIAPKPSEGRNEPSQTSAEVSA